MSVRTGHPVTYGAIGGLESDLSCPVQLRRIRVPRPFAFPVVENAWRISPLLDRLAPVSHGQGAVFLPRATTQTQRPIAVSRDLQEAHRRRLQGAALREGELPPQALDAGRAPLGFNRLPKLLIDDFQLGGRRGFVAHARETEQITWKLRATRMENECSAHSEGCTE